MHDGCAQASARALAEIALIEIDRVTAEVVKALAAAGIQSILLKGPSVRELLYTPAELRPYGDTDLLLPPTQIELAARMLRERGFQKVTTSIGSGRKVHHDVLTRDGQSSSIAPSSGSLSTTKMRGRSSSKSAGRSRCRSAALRLTS